MNVTGEGIRLAIEQKEMKRGGRPLEIANRIMLVFTDGWSNKGPDVEVMTRNAKDAGFILYTIVYEVSLSGFRKISLFETSLTEQKKK